MLSLALPVIAAEVGWVTMQIVDIGMVGQLGPEAIGAVGVGSALFLTLAVVGIGLLLGLDPLIAQAFGAQRFTECRIWARHGLVLAVGLTLPLTLVAWILQRVVDRRLQRVAVACSADPLVDLLEPFLHGGFLLRRRLLCGRLLSFFLCTRIRADGCCDQRDLAAHAARDQPQEGRNHGCLLYTSPSPRDRG